MQYTWLEFCVKPSLIKEYLINQDLPLQRATFQTYLDHLQSLCMDENRETRFTGKKFKRLLQVVYEMNEIYTPILSDFSKNNLNFEFVQHYFQGARQNEYYSLLNYAYTLEYLVEYVVHKELTPEKSANMINFQQLELRLNLSQEPLAILTTQLLIEYNLINEEYNIDNLFILHDKLKLRLTEFPVGYQGEKIEDYRHIVLQIKDELSPVTETDEPDELVVQIESKGSQRQLIERETLIGNSGARMIATYLQNGISTNNRELLLELQKIVSGNDLVVDKIITIHMSNQNQSLEQLIRQYIDLSTIPDISIISILAQLICKNTFGEKDVTKLLINLINKFNKPIVDTPKSIADFVETIQKNQITMPFKIDSYNQNVQLALHLIISNADIKLLLDPLQDIFVNSIDNVTFFIENCLSKFMLEQVQALLLKSISEYNPIEFNNYYSLMPILNTDYPQFEIKLPHEVKVKLLIKSFKREKVITIQHFDSLKLEDQLQFKYSKLYKKQSLFHHKNKQYHKSIRQIVKYFEAYLYNPTFDAHPYVAEIRVLECLFLNFKLIGAPIHCLIASQFISVSLDIAIFENLDITPELAQFFFDGRMIEKICVANHGNQDLLREMAKRIQDPDSYFFKTPHLFLQTQERYLTMFINYLSEEMVWRQ